MQIRAEVNAGSELERDVDHHDRRSVESGRSGESAGRDVDHLHRHGVGASCRLPEECVNRRPPADESYMEIERFGSRAGQNALCWG
jgi:hypothetical protein